jgi:glycosyltransferase involved in cell wall biosynthesis
MIPKEIFTIIIPSKNEEKYIYKSLASISTQIGINSIKIIIADAYSMDNTIKEIQRADKDFDNLDIQIINGGSVSYGRNQGAKVSKTPFLIFMDADSVLLNNDILLQTYLNIPNYDLITVKQKSITTNFTDNLIWIIFDFIRTIMNESFSTGCYFVIGKSKFNKLGAFDENVIQSEDYLLSRNIPKSKFKILSRWVGQDDRRFKKIGYIKFIKIVLMNWLNRNNYEWFKKDNGYWG